MMGPGKVPPARTALLMYKLHVVKAFQERNVRAREPVEVHFTVDDVQLGRHGSSESVRSKTERKKRRGEKVKKAHLDE